jgi:hypothetical protein
MLVQSVAQLEEAILKTEQMLTNMESPCEILDRLTNLRYRLEDLKSEKQALEKEKLDLAMNLNTKLKENRSLIEQILAHTPYDGDYEILDQFQDFVEGL